MFRALRETWRWPRHNLVFHSVVYSLYLFYLPVILRFFRTMSIPRCKSFFYWFNKMIILLRMELQTMTIMYYILHDLSNHLFGVSLILYKEQFPIIGISGTWGCSAERVNHHSAHHGSNFYLFIRWRLVNELLAKRGPTRTHASILGLSINIYETSFHVQIWQHYHQEGVHLEQA